MIIPDGFRTQDEEPALIATDQLTDCYWGQGQKGIIYPDSTMKDEYDISFQLCMCFGFS